MTEQERQGPPIIGLLTIALIIAIVCLTAGFTTGWIVGKGNAQTIIDLIAPSAAQAREQGWVNISEKV